MGVPRARRRGDAPTTSLVVGLMSGTSCDGIDAALVRVSTRPRGRVEVESRATRFAPYDDAFRARLLALPHVEGLELAHLSRDLGRRLARATLALLRGARVNPARVDLVASHGHTAAHAAGGARGRGATLQIGAPAELAAGTGIPVVADFRPADVAAGGEGAPLVPFADRLLLARPGRVVACQNLGGIANVTALGPRPDDLLAFDTGPGNMAIDLAAAHATGGRLRFDRGGRLAGAGRVDEGLVADLLAHPFLRRRPPKSTGREEFGAGFVGPLLRRARTATARRDLVASLTAFTARSVADAYRRFVPDAAECVVSGGGVRNPTLLRWLADALGGVPVVSSAARGIDPDFKEAVAFALLGHACARGLPNTVPAATGARHAVVAGSITPARGRPFPGRG